MKHALWLGAALSLVAKAAFAIQIVITAGTTWTVPDDWNSASNTIEVIGAGASGDIRCGSVIESLGGGGGAYAKGVNVNFTPGAVVNINFSGESGTSGGSGPSRGVWVGSSSTVFAESGWNGGDCAAGSSGGRASASIGSVKYDGGAGSFGSGGGAGVGAGGGAAGPHGAGGIPAGVGSDFTGGVGDAGFGGAGGSTAPGVGGAGTEFDASHGAGGGGGANAGSGGAAGGLYGGGGGYGAAGKQGLIVINYSPRRRVSSGVF